MKRLVTLCSLVALTTLTVSAQRDGFKDYAFYIKLDSGVSSSQSANVNAPYPPWDPAVQGYNARLGHTPIAGLSVGCEILRLLDVEFTVANRSIFNYQKYQTSTISGLSYTRNFDLNVTSVLFTANLLGRGIPHCNWDTGCGDLYPMIGFGLGSSNILITNFRTTGLAPTGDSSPYPSFSAENQYTLRRNFTFTCQLGLEYNFQDFWALATGYRWFDARSFEGPEYQRSSTGSAVDLTDYQWDMRLRSNEWFIEFKIFI